MTADGAAWSVMVGLGETYLPAFVLALSASQLASGLIATVPMFVGAVLQMASPCFVRRMRSYRRWVVLCAGVQAVVFVPLVIAALRGAMPLAVLFLVASAYWASGLAGSPAWNAWAETLVPSRLRSRYFACRSRIGQVGVLLGFGVGGMILQWAASAGRTLDAFALLFVAAGVARAASARFLARQREIRRPDGEMRPPRLGELLRLIASAGDGRLILYLVAAQVAVQLAGPYFTPYMLTQLRLSYAGYAILISAAYLAKIAFFPALGRLVERLGPQRLLWLGALAIVPLPALWNLSDAFAYLVAIQVLAGVAWGAYELSMLLLFFETIPAARRVGLLTVFNLANAAAYVGGSLLGGAVLWAMADGRQAYWFLFLVSTAARAAALVLLVRMPQLAVAETAIATRPLTVRPSMGSLDRPVLPSLSDAESGRHESVEAAAAPPPLPLPNEPPSAGFPDAVTAR